jgi:hypothetical protein
MKERTIVDRNSNWSIPRRERKVLDASPNRDEPEPRTCMSNMTINVIATNIRTTL